MNIEEQKYALINNGEVVNIIIADDFFTNLISRDYEAVLKINHLHNAGIFVAIGWKHINEEFIPPVEEQPIEE